MSARNSTFKRIGSPKAIAKVDDFLTVQVSLDGNQVKGATFKALCGCEGFSIEPSLYILDIDEDYFLLDACRKF